MSLDYLVSGIVGIVLGVYLFHALLFPEKY